MTSLESLLAMFEAVRAQTLALAAPLSPEDQQIQSMPDASPTKWHLAHTSWFFEAMVLGPHDPGYRPYDPRYAYLFNSYYEALGPRHERPRRGLLSRPSLAEIHRYRGHVDDAVRRFLLDGRPSADARALVTLGLHHEQQHQELLLTDAKHALGTNPLRPAYRAPARACASGPPPGPLRFLGRRGGLVETGHDARQGGAAFAFDNEGPRHRAYLAPYALADRLVTAGEYLAFMQDGGYERPELWLADGFAAVRGHGWRAPLYWEPAGDDEAGWALYTPDGLRPVDAAEPVCHVSFYEADAYARWAGARLATEEEWEDAAAAATPEAATGALLEDGRLHPAPAGPGAGPRQLFGDAWEWTSSAYRPYPGYRSPAGAVGEYNGKFMSGQMVLRGGSAFTPGDHLRPTYRNFFPPGTRWQLAGIRLARDLAGDDLAR